MTIEIVIDLEKVVRRYERELGHKLPTWQSRMEAVVAGAINYDDVEGLLTACTEIADNAVRREWKRAEECHPDSPVAIRQRMNRTPLWSSMVALMLEAIETHARTGEPNEACEQTIVNCGAAADEWLADQASAAERRAEMDAWDIPRIIEELEPLIGPLPTWESRMQAIVEVVFRPEHFRKLVTECARIADEPTKAAGLGASVRVRGHGRITTLWSKLVPQWLESLQRSNEAGEPDPNRAQLISCGKAADAWLSQQETT